jgi:F-type H+-transporting ATPase subunit delta
MQDSLISKRYADALLSLSLELQNVEEVLVDMEEIGKMYAQDKEFVQFLRSPVFKPEKKQRALKIAFKGKVNELTLNFLALITKHRRENILDQIARQYIAQYKEHYNIITTWLTTAVKVSEEVKKEITQLLEEYTHGNIELIEKVDQKLIGGFTLRFNDNEFDSSLRKVIHDLRKEFSKNIFVRKI